MTDNIIDIRDLQKHKYNLENLHWTCPITGEHWYPFSLDYKDPETGGEYSMEFWAKSLDDAERRAKIVQQTEIKVNQISEVEYCDR